MVTLVPVLMFYYSKIALGDVSPSMIKDYAVVESRIANLSIEDQNKVLTIIQSESGFNTKALHENDNGIGCNSRGLVQIRDCNHKDISPQQAYDPVFAVNYLIKNIDKCTTWWKATCPLPSP